MSTLPPRSRPNVSLPPTRQNPADADASSESNEEGVLTEFLLIKLEHDIPNGVTNVSFEGKGFDVDNEDIVVDILNTAATVYDYVLVAEEDVTYEDVDENE